MRGNLPEEYVVVRVGGAGVTGSLGVVQSLIPLDKRAEVGIRPRPTLRAFKSGNVFLQHLFLKSSKSMLHRAAPARSFFKM
jgi:hypothetical protein